MISSLKCGSQREEEVLALNTQEREKQKAELQNSEVYFLKDLKNEIEEEQRFSVLLPLKDLSGNNLSVETGQGTKKDPITKEFYVKDDTKLDITIPGFNTTFVEKN